MPKVFVYGTLRNGERNHDFMEGAKCIYTQCRIKGKLFDTDKGYPIMRHDEASWVYGELYDVSDVQMKSINELEEYAEGRADNLYNRVTVDVWNDKGEENSAFVFIAKRAMDYITQEIQSGDWTLYQYIKQDKLLYFAYGSCMDDERFRLAGTDHFFKDVVGAGTLKDFEFRFSIHTDDGGKADIVENKSKQVEGKVYQVPLETLDYLYKREGVYNNIYRPAVVPISIAGKPVYALTFIGIRKVKETAPTIRYGTEILRGGKGCLSDDYRRKVNEKIDNLQKGQ
ncbi:gamma-glutamylcyclotransferase [Virgibacillus siamensis]|uniref:gamma-glutamylcyclotransferase n=1 Tax=Virgibacillus siamensis TaxID=480071 RepID=UPI00158A3809|nr:gamma-glutamylcyclotransferase family protein [Virgibacillus siamensis]